ncbi:rCG27114 [Rattus norvegicus]|uniref:RCG27114 n=1 Tax=Rattus norvegicus TaxID=10116 RepID=A6HMT4_RAT|nr:rCG27114 [Rattus norvegicus]
MTLLSCKCSQDPYKMSGFVGSQLESNVPRINSTLNCHPHLIK